MSEIYCQTCDDKNNSYDLNSPACLINISNNRVKQMHRNVLNVESEIEFSSGKSNSNNYNKSLKNKKLLSSPKKDKNKSSPKKEPALSSVSATKAVKNENSFEDDRKLEEYELADDATSLNGCDMTDDSGVAKIGLLNDIDTKLMIRVNGKEEFPVVEANSSVVDIKRNSMNYDRVTEFLKVNKKNSKSDIPSTNDNKSSNKTPSITVITNENCNSHQDQLVRNVDQEQDQKRSTLPKIKKPMDPNNYVLNRTMKILPKRRTADGTNIYYWCDISKKKIKGLCKVSFILICYCIDVLEYFD